MYTAVEVLDPHVNRVRGYQFVLAFVDVAFNAEISDTYENTSELFFRRLHRKIFLSARPPFPPLLLETRILPNAAPRNTSVPTADRTSRIQNTATRSCCVSPLSLLFPLSAQGGIHMQQPTVCDEVAFTVLYF